MTSQEKIDEIVSGILVGLHYNVLNFERISLQKSQLDPDFLVAALRTSYSFREEVPGWYELRSRAISEFKKYGHNLDELRGL